VAKAPDKTQPNVNDQVREALKRFLRSLWIIVPVVLLAYTAYQIFFQSNPRRELKTVDATLAAYTQFVRDYTGAAGGRPNAVVVRDWLSFFDGPSREFFEENIDGLAFTLYQFQAEDFKALSASARREKAMVAVVSRAPLNGIARVIEQRPRNDGGFTIIAQGISGQQTLTMKKDGELWYIAELGGLRQVFAAEIEAQKSLRPK